MTVWAQLETYVVSSYTCRCDSKCHEFLTCSTCFLLLQALLAIVYNRSWGVLVIL